MSFWEFGVRGFFYEEELMVQGVGLLKTDFRVYALGFGSLHRMYSEAPGFEASDLPSP